MKVLAHHLVFSAYGFWLPNDPRGSWSTFVGSERLYEMFGPATKVSVRESLASKPHDRHRRLAAKNELKFPPAVFTGRQALEVGRAIGELADAEDLVVLACAVMPEHVHLVAACHRLMPSKIVGGCRARASRRLREAGLWPQARPVWGKGKWIVPLATPHEVLMRIRYVERNPAAAGLPRQKWSFVRAYDGCND